MRVCPIRKLPWLLGLTALVLAFGVGLPWLRSGHQRRAPAQRLARASRYLYVWDGAIPGDTGRTRELLRFAARQRISGVFIEASPLGYGEPGAADRYRAFVERLHRARVRVLALGGHPFWTVPCDAGVPGQPTCFDEGWDFYERIAQSGVEFDGILDDSEPQGTHHAGGHYFWDGLPGSAQDYLDFLHGLRARIGELELTVATPFWFDTDERLVLALDGEAAARPLHLHVAGIADVVQVMAYRDHAAGPGGILEVSAGELAAGPSIVAVETADLGPEGDATTFWEEGRAHLERELETLHDGLGDDPAYRGVAIHHHASLRDLAE